MLEIYDLIEDVQKQLSIISQLIDLIYPPLTPKLEILNISFFLCKQKQH